MAVDAFRPMSCRCPSSERGPSRGAYPPGRDHMSQETATFQPQLTTLRLVSSASRGEQRCGPTALGRRRSRGSSRGRGRCWGHRGIPIIPWHRGAYGRIAAAALDHFTTRIHTSCRSARPIDGLACSCRGLLRGGGGRRGRRSRGRMSPMSWDRTCPSCQPGSPCQPHDAHIGGTVCQGSGRSRMTRTRLDRSGATLFRIVRADVRPTGAWRRSQFISLQEPYLTSGVPCAPGSSEHALWSASTGPHRLPTSRVQPLAGR